MAREVIPHELKDWSQIRGNADVWDGLDLSNPEVNFGIHRYNDALWTSGFIGVGRIFDKRGIPIQSHGKEHIAIVTSQYGLDPWKMLEVVMADDEYDDYIEELNRDGKTLYKVFYDQPIIRLAQSGQNNGDLLYALSFLDSCYALCKKGLKKTIIHKEENYTSKIRGKIKVSQNIRENTCRGRNDRFYCQFLDFTQDNIENRIIKYVLLKCKGILASRFKDNAEVSKRMIYCLNSLRRVKSTSIKQSDFSSTSVSGLYMYYKPLLAQARCIFNQKYYSYSAENGHTISESVYTIPYCINMETLFEFYARSMLKKSIDVDKFVMACYSKRLFLQDGATKIEESEKGIHIIPYCIPDIIIKYKDTNLPVIVIDAKYKPHERTARFDTHQLLSYVLLTGVQKCGFIFPGMETKVKQMVTSEAGYLPLCPKDLKYYEMILGTSAIAHEYDGILS